MGPPLACGPPWRGRLWPAPVRLGGGHRAGERDARTIPRPQASSSRLNPRALAGSRGPTRRVARRAQRAAGAHVGSGSGARPRSGAAALSRAALFHDRSARHWGQSSHRASASAEAAPRRPRRGMYNVCSLRVWWGGRHRVGAWSTGGWAQSRPAATRAVGRGEAYSGYRVTALSSKSPQAVDQPSLSASTPWPAQ